MSGFIEEFYYGNIDPQARGVKRNSRIQKQIKLLSTNEEFESRIHRQRHCFRRGLTASPPLCVSH